MSYFITCIKAWSLERKYSAYKYERELTLNPEDGKKKRRKKNFIQRLCSKFANCFRRCHIIPKNSCLGRFLKKLRTRDTLENYVMKSAFGLLGGFILTYFFFFFFVLGVNFNLKSATYICSILEFIFCIGLAFSSKIRCLVFLLLPQFFTKRGRQALMAYAFILSLTGPAKNTLHNMGVLSTSLACGQEELKRAMNSLIEAIKQPYRSIKHTIIEIKKSIQEVVDNVKETISNIKRIIMGILNVIKTAMSWLGSLVSFCNKKFGTPFDRCMRVFDDAIIDCKAKMGVMDFMCYVVNAVQPICYTVKFLDLICMFVDFVSDAIIGVVKKRLREFSRHIQDMFYVSIEFSHSHEMHSNQSKSLQEISSGIATEFRDKTDKILSFFDAMSFVFSLFFLFIFVKVLLYRYKFLSVDSYDNYYINNLIVDIDMRRAKMEKDTILPLEPREQQRYIKVSSLRLIRSEKKTLMSSFVMLSISTFKMVIYIVSDYCLYWILYKIRYYGKFKMSSDSGKVGVHVQGEGYMPDLYRKLISSLEPSSVDTEVDSTPCLPDPVPPDIGRYVQIGFLTVLCWILAVTEPYGLRVRHIIMSYYHPERAKERAVWLYNHILRTRGSFIKFARRQLRRKLKGNDGSPIERVTLKDRVFGMFPWLRSFLGMEKEKMCLLCGQVLKDPHTTYKCPTPDCVGIYCQDCFTVSLKNKCTMCLHPIEYGDLSDISEEKDSSDEDQPAPSLPTTVENTEESDDTEATRTTIQDTETRRAFRDLERNRTRNIISYPDSTSEDTSSESESETDEETPLTKVYRVRNRK